MALHAHWQMGYRWPHHLGICPCSRWSHRQTGGNAECREKLCQSFTSSCTSAIISSSSLPPSHSQSRARPRRARQRLYTRPAPHPRFAFVYFVWAGGFLQNKASTRHACDGFFLLLRACKGKSLCCGWRDEKKSGCNARCCNSWTTCRSYTESSRAVRMILARFLKPCQLNPSWIEILFKNWCGRKPRLSSTFVLWDPLSSQEIHPDAVRKSKCLSEFLSTKSIFFYILNQCNTETGFFLHGEFGVGHHCQICYRHQLTAQWSKVYYTVPCLDQSF